MKKFLTLAVAMVLVFGLATATYAIEVTHAGYVRILTGWGVNLGNLGATSLYDGIANATSLNGAGDLDDDTAWVQTRGRLRFNIAADDYVKGEIWFEVDDWWGGTAEGDVGADATSVELQHANLSFKVPGMEDVAPTTLTAGIQSFYTGRLVVDDDASGLRADMKAGPAEIRLYWIKEIEDDHTESEDVDDYGFRVTVPIGDFRPGALLHWTHAGKGGTTTSQAAATNSTSDVWWLGFTLDGKVGPASLEADFVYNGGTVDYSVPVAGVSEDEYGGWAFRVMGSVPLAEMFEVGGEFFYSTGDDKRDRARGEFEGFRRPFRGGYAYHPLVVYYASAINDWIGLTNDPGGDWFIKGFASAKPLDWLKLTVLAAYIGDTVDNGDKFDNSGTSPGISDDSDAGIEVSAIAEMQIYKELAFRVLAGFLFAGDALDQDDIATGVSTEPDDPYLIATQLIYSW